MGAKGFIVPPGGDFILSMAPGRSAVLELLDDETGNSVMLFEETAPLSNGILRRATNLPAQ